MSQRCRTTKLNKQTIVNKIVKHIILTFLFLTPINVFGLSFGFEGKYIPIDSLSQEHSLRYVSLDIKTREIELQVGNQTLIFLQEIELDTTRLFVVQSLISRLENEQVTLRIIELLEVDNDSIYVSAEYRKFNIRRGRVESQEKIEMLGVCKSELLGVIVSVQTAREINRNRSRFYWFAGTFAVIVSVLSIIFGA
jgi:hypothetical protein